MAEFRLVGDIDQARPASTSSSMEFMETEGCPSGSDIAVIFDLLDDVDELKAEACGPYNVECVPNADDNNAVSLYGEAGELETENVDENQDEPVMDEEPYRNSIHPLLIPNVVAEVMQGLPSADIEAFRLVCRAWNDEACKVLKRKRIVAFLDPDAVRVYNKAMKDTTLFPHSKYEFCIPDISGTSSREMREFWSTFGTNIKSLEFRQSNLSWNDFFAVLDEKVPHLEKLALRYLPRISRVANVPADERHHTSVRELRLASLPSIHPAAVERLTELLKALPLLEVIEFLPIKPKALKSKVSAVLVEVLGKPEVSLPKLRKINLNLELNSEAVDALALKHYPFQTLQLTLGDGVKAASFKNLITSLRTTLTELKISFPDFFSNSASFTHANSMKPEESLQVLQNLRTLHIFNLNCSVNFVQYLPKLEELEFTTSQLARTIPFGFTRKSSSSFSRFHHDHHLKRLKIKPRGPILLAEPTIAETFTLDSISRCFPFLTCLHLRNVDDDGLGVIYRNLPFLSEVELLEAKCTDQGLTGIPLEICVDMLETSTFIIVQADRYRRDLFIGSLQFLTKLTVLGTEITDASIALGIVDCKNLRELKIGSPLISDTGIIFITDKFCKQLDALNVSGCSELTDQSVFYANEKFIGKLTTQSASPKDLPSQLKQSIAAVSLNKDRAIVMPKCKGFVNMSTSKFNVPDKAFFEEMVNDAVFVEGIPQMVFPLQAHADRHRMRMVRIREAVRRNGEFMRGLQRFDAEQFHRIGVGMLEVHNLGEDFNVVNIEEVPIEGEAVRRRIRLNLREELRDFGINGNVEGAAAIEPPQNVLHDNQLAEIFRLGLRLDDVEFWLRHQGLFDRGEENGNGDAGGGVQDDIEEERLAGEGIPPGVGFGGDPDEDLMDMEVFRRGVLNAIVEDMPELPFDDQEG